MAFEFSNKLYVTYSYVMFGVILDLHIISLMMMFNNFIGTILTFI